MNSTRKKLFELSHHLGNVRSLIADVKINESLAGGGMEQRAETLMSSDYYPFGMTIGESHVESEGYRYGFQGQEEDDELWGGAVSYKYRIEDPRLGRFFSVDPLTSKYPHYTPYSFSGNKLIAFRELEGLEEISMHQSRETVNGEELILTSDRSYGGNQQGLGYEGVYQSQTIDGEFYESYFPDYEAAVVYENEPVEKEEGSRWSWGDDKLIIAGVTVIDNYSMQGSADGANTGGRHGGEEGWHNGGKQIVGATASVVFLPFAIVEGVFVGGIAIAGAVSAVDDAVILDNNATPLSQTVLGEEYANEIQGTKMVINAANIYTGAKAIIVTPGPVLAVDNAVNLISIGTSTVGAHENYSNQVNGK